MVEHRDPAVEAALRVGYTAGEMLSREEQLTAAAREALKPIRELHQPITMCGVTCCQRCRTPDGASASWPCATAKLVYTSEELSGE